MAPQWTKKSVLWFLHKVDFRTHLRFRGPLDTIFFDRKWLLVNWNWENSITAGAVVPFRPRFEPEMLKWHCSRKWAGRVSFSLFWFSILMNHRTEFSRSRVGFFVMVLFLLASNRFKPSFSCGMKHPKAAFWSRRLRIRFRKPHFKESFVLK